MARGGDAQSPGAMAVPLVCVMFNLSWVCLPWTERPFQPKMSRWVTSPIVVFDICWRLFPSTSCCLQSQQRKTSFCKMIHLTRLKYITPWKRLFPSTDYKGLVGGLLRYTHLHCKSLYLVRLIPVISITRGCWPTHSDVSLDKLALQKRFYWLKLAV